MVTCVLLGASSMTCVLLRGSSITCVPAGVAVECGEALGGGGALDREEFIGRFSPNDVSYTV